MSHALSTPTATFRCDDGPPRARVTITHSNLLYSIRQPCYGNIWCLSAVFASSSSSLCVRFCMCSPSTPKKKLSHRNTLSCSRGAGEAGQGANGAEPRKRPRFDRRRRRLGSVFGERDNKKSLRICSTQLSLMGAGDRSGPSQPTRRRKDQNACARGGYRDGSNSWYPS